MRKCFPLWERSTSADRNVYFFRFIEEFMSKHRKSVSCDCRFHEKVICDICVSKSAAVKKFMTNASNTIKAHELWNSCEGEEIKMAVTQTQRYIMGTLYDTAFTITKDDIELKRELANTADLDLEDFEIPEKYHSEAPWTFAQLGTTETLFVQHW